jgi:hypothetical protein
LGHLPFTEKQVITPTGKPHQLVDYIFGTLISFAFGLSQKYIAIVWWFYISLCSELVFICIEGDSSSLDKI